VGNWVNWLLVIGGIVCVIIELALGALTGFDLALLGASLTVGGGIGILAGSAKIGLLAAGVLALLYLAVFRSWLKRKLTVKEYERSVITVLGKNDGVAQRGAVFMVGRERRKLTVKDQASNVDAVVGKTGVVTKRIAVREPGMVKVGSEIWRAELSGGDETARDVGAVVVVQSVEGVALRVR
jgi:membrane protein implicated in regulation of membrane protease activity